jgi:hypothetical protein
VPRQVLSHPVVLVLLWLLELLVVLQVLGNQQLPVLLVGLKPPVLLEHLAILDPLEHLVAPEYQQDL